jgi:hypothetical protein
VVWEPERPAERTDQHGMRDKKSAFTRIGQKPDISSRARPIRTQQKKINPLNQNPTRGALIARAALHWNNEVYRVEQVRPRHLPT